MFLLGTYPGPIILKTDMVVVGTVVIGLSIACERVRTALSRDGRNAGRISLDTAPAAELEYLV